MSISNLILSLLVLLIVMSLFFGLLILIVDKGWIKIINRRFFILSITVVLWQAMNLVMLVTSLDNIISLFITRLSFVAVVIMIYALLRFVLVFPQNYQNKTFSKIIDCLTAITVLFMAILSLTPQLVKNVYSQNNVLYANYGSFFTVFSVSIIILLLAIFIVAFTNYRKSDQDSKIQIKFMLIGITLTALVGIFTDLISPLIYKTDYLSNFGAFGTLFLVVFTAYAIIKYQLFNIKVILTETAVGLVVLVMLIQVLLSENQTQSIINVVMLLLVSYGGYLIVKSVLIEIKQKEELQTLSTQLSEANVHLKDLDKMKTEFVSLASHELLTPVSAIEGYLSMMLDEKLVTLEDPKAVQYMDRVYRSSKRLARLIADMLNISRIEEGRLLVEKKDVDMVELINQVLEELKFKAEEHKQKMVFQDTSNKIQDTNKNQEPITNNQSITPSTELGAGNNQTITNNELQITNNKSHPSSFMTFADPDKIKEVLVNLMGNSIKYTLEPGTITVTIEKVPTKTLTDEWGKLESIILASPVDDQESIHAVGDDHLKQIIGNEQYLIRVKDEGVGIPKEELPKLFKKFHRVGNFSTQESQGTGLGLYITRALVELHHGRVWPDSEGMGKGSTFTFSLPTIEAKQAIIDLEAQSPDAKEQLKPLAKPMGNDDAL